MESRHWNCFAHWCSILCWCLGQNWMNLTAHFSFSTFGFLALLSLLSWLLWYRSHFAFEGRVCDCESEADILTVTNILVNQLSGAFSGANEVKVGCVKHKFSWNQYSVILRLESTLRKKLDAKNSVLQETYPGHTPRRCLFGFYLSTVLYVRKDAPWLRSWLPISCLPRTYAQYLQCIP